ncbi:MAG: hypothetical protein WB869_20635 [Candidatus Acidiferrales bacterium]
MEEIYQAAQRRRAAKRAGVPQVGVVFVAKGKPPFIDSTPVTEAEGYAHFKIHGRDHHRYWQQLQQMKAVPSDVEYDEVPRGRAVYDTVARNYTLFLDRCILRNKKLVSRIISAMNLPFESTETATDDHYRCPKCLPKRDDRCAYHRRTALTWRGSRAMPHAQ